MTPADSSILFAHAHLHAMSPPAANIRWQHFLLMKQHGDFVTPWSYVERASEPCQWMIPATTTLALSATPAHLARDDSDGMSPEKINCLNMKKFLDMWVFVAELIRNDKDRREERGHGHEPACRNCYCIMEVKKMAKKKAKKKKTKKKATKKKKAKKKK
jgi:hypothetical protein